MSWSITNIAISIVSSTRPELSPFTTNTSALETNKEVPASACASPSLLVPSSNGFRVALAEIPPWFRRKSKNRPLATQNSPRPPKTIPQHHKKIYSPFKEPKKRNTPRGTRTRSLEITKQSLLG
ncbi:uncharacterized protein BKA78DRAFT_50548 [Phyllosticta capitalensis]|uniref:uncharacterized protein n=1 Tax=Phyllosticta capitalensis TaxID=121624 RepID=UPI00312E36BD